MSMLATQISNLYNAPSIVRKLLGFKLKSDDDKMCEKAVKALVKKITKSEMLNELEKALITQDEHSQCVTITRSQDGRVQVSQRKNFPHQLYCNIWRWPDLQNLNELKSVDHCLFPYNSKKDVVCINPYHYVRVGANNLTVYVPTKPMNEPNQHHANGNIIGCGSAPSSIPGTMFNNHFSASDMSMDVTMSETTTPPQQIVPQKHQQIVPQKQQQHVLQSQLSSNGSTNSLSILQPQASSASELSQSPTSSSPFTLSIAGGSAAANIGTASHVISSQFSHNYPILDSPISPGLNPLSPNSMFSQCSPLYSEDDSSEITDQMRSPLSNLDFQPVSYVEQSHWCSISYYEMKQRVGETFHATANSLIVDGFTDPGREKRFCLGVLSNINRTPEIELTRRYIGHGIRLENNGFQVYVECLSDNPVFVQSPIANKQQNWHLATVCKVPPKCKLVIFDVNVFSDLLSSTLHKGYEEVYALTRLCTIRMSFVKGWGAEYRRQSILNTPCWIEIHLNSPLQWIDSILTKMGAPTQFCTSNS